MVYEGPGLVRALNRGLLGLLERDGLSNIAEAVGLDSVAPDGRNKAKR